MTSRSTSLKNQGFPTLLKMGLTVGILTGTLVFPGCKKKAPPPPPPPPPPKVVEPEWQLVSAGMGLSPNVTIENAEYIECSDAQMRASFLFIDALARGNDQALRSMLGMEMVPVLDNLVESEEWQESTAGIRSIDLISCTAESSKKVRITFAVQSEGDIGSMTQIWNGRTRGNSVLFSADYVLEEVRSADDGIHISAERILLGKSAFETGRCSRCHGDDAKGTGRGPNLTDNKWVHGNGSIRAILQVLKNGIAEEDIKDEQFRRKMPPATERITDDDEVRALAEYIWALSHPDRADGLDAENSDEDDQRSSPGGKGRNPPSRPGGPG